MPNALQLLIPGLTPLQQAAVEKIHDYQKELAKLGLYTRTGVELKFVTEDIDGIPSPSSIYIHNAEQYLKASSPYIAEFDHADISSDDIPRNPTKYQIEFLDRGGIAQNIPAEEVHIDPVKFSPSLVAQAVAETRQRTLKEMLEQTSCLISEDPKIRPSFLARPHMEWEDSPYGQVTAGMHINMSLYNERGDNLFAGSQDLQAQCAEGVVHVQNNAALAFLPYDNSLMRLGANGYVTTATGSGYNKKDNQTSVSLRTSTPSEPDPVRIENRLPGADADPYVAIALTMAGMIYAVRHNVSPEKDTAHVNDPEIEGRSLLVAPNQWLKILPCMESLPNTPIPKTHKLLVKQFEASSEMRDLLGNKLYKAIKCEYGAAKVPAMV